MIQLYRQDESQPFAEITEEQLKFLEDELVEESTTDQDYAITPMTLRLFVEDHIDPQLLALLKQALGDQDEITIRWERT
ncbi:MAG: galactosyldiacylglycerol synthase [Anaerolineales bacterium]